MGPGSDIPGYSFLSTGFNLYHLKMINPERRAARRDLYSRLDPKQKYQALGYDYLLDEFRMGSSRLSRAAEIFFLVIPKRPIVPCSSLTGPSAVKRSRCPLLLFSRLVGTKRPEPHRVAIGPGQDLGRPLASLRERASRGRDRARRPGQS